MSDFGNDYEKLDERFIPDCQSKSLYLRHKKTGLEIFSLANDDEENLFAFAFRTPVLNGTGVAHIIEHSVFCGSEKYPLKEPFVNLMNQSLYTFLNAMTYPDKTVYPASSVNKADFFHLLDVYADAVFFPLLKKETFLQEGRRFEISDDGKISLQGVVYNEMKGNYSSFYSVAFDVQYKTLLQNSCYAFDSGGDPKKIPELSYEDFLNFHKNYYKPENCLLFFYGNIPIAEKIAFLEKNVFPRIERKQKNCESKKDEIENFKKKLQSFKTVVPLKREIFVKATAPNTNAKHANVTLAFRVGSSRDMQSIMETNFLLQILCGNDSSPLSKVLLDSKLGDDVISGGGADSSVLSFYVGLSGVKKNNAKAVQKLILRTLQEIVHNGFLRDDIESALLALDFANREIIRNHGDPFSIELLERALNGWNYGGLPSNTLLYESACRSLKEKIKNDENYARNLLRKKILENNERAFVVVLPDKNFLLERDAFEKKVLKRAKKEFDAKRLIRETKHLHDYQARKESEAEKSCIPFLKRSDLKNCLDPINTRVISCAVNGGAVSIFLNDEKTNGIVYIDAAFPCDALCANDYAVLPSFCLCALNTGWCGKKWDACLKEASLCFGDLSVHFSSGTVSETDFAKKYIESVNDKNYLGRDWIVFSVKFPEEKILESLSLFSNALCRMDFRDEKRISSLLSESFNDMRASIIPHGSRYALLRSASTFSREGALDEMMNGISQLIALKKLQKEKSLSEIFSRIAKTIFDSGAIVHVTASDTKKIENDIFDFVKKTNMKPLSSVRKKTLSDFEPYLLKGTGALEHLKIDSSISFLGESFLCGFKTPEEKAASEALSHWMRSNILWEKMRTIGGAYGAGALFDWVTNVFSLSTYRDPDAFHSLSIVKDCFDEMYEMHIGANDAERSIVGSYGSRVYPLSPANHAYRGFKQKLYAVTIEEQNAELRSLLQLDADALHSIIGKLREKVSGARASIIAGGNIKNASECIKLPI